MDTKTGASSASNACALVFRPGNGSHRHTLLPWALSRETGADRRNADSLNTIVIYSFGVVGSQKSACVRYIWLWHSFGECRHCKPYLVIPIFLSLSEWWTGLLTNRSNLSCVLVIKWKASWKCKSSDCASAFIWLHMRFAVGVKHILIS